VAVTARTIEVARRIAHENPNIDESLPFWARRSNPIVRRELGIYWRVVPPQVGPMMKWTAVQAILMLLTIAYPVLLIVILTLLLAAMLLLPVGLYIYIKALGEIIHTASASMADEYKNDTMTLLRTTPYTVKDIVLSKISAAVWRRMDELDQVMTIALGLSVPALAIIYLSLYPPESGLAYAQILTVVGLVASLVRLPLEMFMVSSLGVMMGSAVKLRTSAFVSTAGLAFFYFLLINLLRLVPMAWWLHLIVDSVLPVALPLIISYGAIKATIRLIKQD
jgi:hypothetical protein